MKPITVDRRKRWTLEAVLLLYLGASFLHFAHNAENVRDYPNLPEWITRASVYGAWFTITAVGLLGYLAWRFKPRIVGFLLLQLYAVAGLDGLLHYTRAPLHEHSFAMNFTILFEVAAASLLLLYLWATARARLSSA